MKYTSVFLLIGVLLIFSCQKDPVTPSGEKYFPKVKVIIQNHCLSCHYSGGSWAGRPVAFDTDEEIVASAAPIKASVADPVSTLPGDMGNRRMPQDTVLAQNDIDVIVKWLEKGGKATD